MVNLIFDKSSYKASIKLNYSDIFYVDFKKETILLIWILYFHNFSWRA